MKKFIVNHGEKVLCAVVVAVCIYTIVDAVRVPENEIVTKINDAKGKIQDALDTNKVGPDFRYHVSRREPFASGLAEHLKRAEDIPQELAPAYAFYPQPEKPEIVAKPEAPKPTSSPAILTALTSFTAKPEHGKAILASRVPKAPAGLKHFFPVRIEVFRGAAADKADEKVGAVELGPEVEGEAVETKAGPKVDEPGKLEAEGTTARSAKVAEGKAETKKGPRGKSKTTKAAEPTIDYEDYEVAPKTTYWYRARLVARLEKLGPDNMLTVEGKAVQVTIPPELVKVPGKEEGVTLYASAWTPVVSATLPPDILVRFAGLIGVVPDNPDPRFAPSGYGGNFGIRIWRAKKRAWAEATLPVDVGRPIAGKATFRVGNDSEELKYETDLTLVDIKRATIVDVKARNEPVTKEVKNEQTGEIDRVPVLDEEGKPVYKEVLIENRSPTEVALLKRGEGGQIERFPKAGGSEWETKDARVFLEGEQEPPPAAPEKKAEAPVKKAEEPAAPKKAEGVRAPAHVKKAEEPAKK